TRARPRTPSAWAEPRRRARRAPDARADAGPVRTFRTEGRGRVCRRDRMRLLRRSRSLIGRLSLTRQVALLSLLPMIPLGLILPPVLQGQIVDRTLADATRSARIIARLGVQPTLTPQNLQHGLGAAEVQELDGRLNGPSVGEDLARIKVWNAGHQIVYS